MRFLSLFVVAVLAQQQSIISFQSPSGAFVLENFETVRFEPPGLHGEARGGPFRLRWRDRGIELIGRTGTVDAARDEKGGYYLTRANIAGGIRLTQDTAIADEFLADQARASGAVTPPTNPNPSSMVLTTDALSYAGDASTGTITIPGPFDVATKSHRTSTVASKADKNARVRQVVDEATTIHANSGTITFSTELKDVNSLRTGTATAPVVHLVRNTVTDGKPDPTTDVTASADTMTLDFTGAEHSITLMGNVEVKGAADVYAGYTKAAKAVIFFGADGKITRIEMTGSPTESNIKPRPAGGGGH